MLKPFLHYLQLDKMDCGPTCLRMIAKHYGRSYTLQTLRERSFITREGVSMLGISDVAETIGFRTTGVKISMFQLITGMQEIKLNNCETEKRWQWERIQVGLRLMILTFSF